MEQKRKMERIVRKRWHKPNIEIITASELKKLVVSGACSVYIGACDVFRATK